MTIYVGITRQTLHCAECHTPCVTTYRPIKGKVFRCPDCRVVARKAADSAYHQRQREKARAAK